MTQLFTLQRLTSLAKSCRLRERTKEDQRLFNLQEQPSAPPLDDTSVQATSSLQITSSHCATAPIQSQDEDTSFMEWMTPSPPSLPSSINEDSFYMEWMTLSPPHLPHQHHQMLIEE